MVRDFSRKLRLAAAARGCGTRKALAAAFRAVNPESSFDVERADKWLHGKATPRDSAIYRDWAKLLDLDRPYEWLAQCAADELLDLVASRHGVAREVLVERTDRFVRAGAAPDTPHAAARLHYLEGSYVCYSHAWSPYFAGRRLRGTLTIGPTIDDQRVGIVYGECLPIGRLRFEGNMTFGGRAMQLDLREVGGGEIRLFFSMFVPPPPASVLAGLMCGSTATGASPEPTACRIVMVRLLAPSPELESSDAYLEPEHSIAADLVLGGWTVDEPAHLDQMVNAFLSITPRNGIEQVASVDYAGLVELFDRQLLGQVKSPPLLSTDRPRLTVVGE